MKLILKSIIIISIIILLVLKLDYVFPLKSTPPENFVIFEVTDDENIKKIPICPPSHYVNNSSINNCVPSYRVELYVNPNNSLNRYLTVTKEEQIESTYSYTFIKAYFPGEGKKSPLLIALNTSSQSSSGAYLGGNFLGLKPNSRKYSATSCASALVDTSNNIYGYWKNDIFFAKVKQDSLNKYVFIDRLRYPYYSRFHPYFVEYSLLSPEGNFEAETILFPSAFSLKDNASFSIYFDYSQGFSFLFENKRYPLLIKQDLIFKRGCGQEIYEISPFAIFLKTVLAQIGPQF